MRSFFSKSRYNLASHIAIWSALIHFSTTDYCYTQDMYGSFLGAISNAPQENDEAKYTVNFNNVSVIEVIRFVSKITGSNFVFAENELQFNVTIISEEPISAKNFISALIQVLRINGMKLLEQEGNFLITQNSSDVNQIPTIVSGDIPGSLQTSAPIVTRVFRVKNAKIASLVSIFKPLTSKSSLIEVSEQTKQLIITDVTTNIDKIAILLQSLDTPHSNFEIESYTVKHIYPPDIISLTQKILEPFLEGTPLLFVPQIEANTIFIISTPHLIERSLAVMEDVDVPAQLQTVGTGSNAHNSIFYVYPIQKGNAKQIKASLSDLASKAKDAPLQAAIETAQWIQETNSLVFMIPPSLSQNLQTLLTALDTPNSNPDNQIYCYKILHAKEPQIEAALEQMAQTFKDPAFATVVQSLKWIEESNTLVFSGTAESIAKLPSILEALDVPNSKDNIYIYQIQNIPEEQLTDALQKLVETIQDPELISSIKSMKWVKESNQLIFNGNPTVIRKLQDILPSLDTAGSSLQIYMYKVGHAPKKQISSSLQILASTTQNKDLSDAIKELKWLDDSNTLVFRTTPAVITKLQTILTTLDTTSPELELYMYKIRNTPKDQVLAKLKQMSSSIQDKALLEAIQNATIIPESNTLMFHATPAVNAKLQNILTTLDVKDQELQIYMYKALHAPKKQITSSLEKLANTIQNKELSDAIKELKWIEESNTFMFHATPTAIEKLQTILPTLDVEGIESHLYMYKIKNADKEKLVEKLGQIANTIQDKDLLAAIKNASLLPDSDTLLFHATSAAGTKLENLLTTLDVAGPELQLYMYKIQNAQKKQVIASLEHLANTIKNKELSSAVKGVDFIEESNTLVFHTTPAVIAQLQSILPSVDTTGSHLQLYIYKIQNASNEQIASRLEQMTGTLQDKDLLEAIKNSKVIPESRTLVFHARPAVNAKLQEILSTLDVKGTELQLHMVKIEHVPKDKITAELKQMVGTIQDKELLAALKSITWLPDSATLMFHAEPPVSTNLQNILAALDTATPNLQLYMYKIKNTAKEQLMTKLGQVASTIQDKDLLSAIKNASLLPDSTTLLFHATSAAGTKLENLLATLDVAGPELQLYMYKVQNAQKKQITNSLEHLANSIKNKELSEAVKGMDFLEESNTLVFHANPAVIAQLQSILPSVDTIGSHLHIYKIQNASNEQIVTRLEQLATTLQDKDLLEAIKNSKVIPESRTLVFHATPAVNAKLQEILSTLDVKGAELQLHMVKIEHVPKDKIAAELKQMASTIQDKELLAALKSITWLPDSATLIFHAAPTVSANLQNILTALDIATPDLQLYMYKVRNTPKEQVLAKLKQLSSTIQDKALLEAIQNTTLIPESNTLIFHATAAANTTLQNILATLDVKDQELQIYMYKALHAPKKQMASSLEQLANTIQNKELSDAVKQMKWIAESNTFMFHATPSAIEKLQALLPTLDVEGIESHLYMYKIKNIDKETLLTKLGQIAGTIQDKDLLAAIKNASLLPDSNTLMFHATSAAGTKLENLLNTLDVTGPELQLYTVKIQYTSKKQIIDSLERLASKIKHKDLSDAIKEMEWIDESNTLLFHATPSAIAELQTIIPSLDKATGSQLYTYKIHTASNEQITARLEQLASTIQDKDLLDAIKGSSLLPESRTLVFHATPDAHAKLQEILATLDVKGEELQLYSYKLEHASKKQITSSLEKFAATMQNKDLSTAISQMTWIPESNTLLFYATQPTVDKLKTLIPSLDASAPDLQLYAYKIHSASNDQMMTRLEQVTSTIQDKDLLDVIKKSTLVKESKTLVFHATPAIQTKLLSLLSTLDVKGEENQLYTYKLERTSKKQITASLEQLAKAMQNKDLSNAISQMKWIPESNTLLFYANQATLDKLQTLVPPLDTSGPELQLYMYKIQNIPKEQLTAELDNITATIQDAELLAAIKTIAILPESNTILFHATPAIHTKLQTILSTLDVKGEELQFYTYKIERAPKEQLFAKLEQMTGTIQDKTLLNAIKNASLIPDSNTLMFHATPGANTKLQSLLTTLDVANPEMQLYMVKIQNVSRKQITASLEKLANTIKNKDFSDAIAEMKWMEESNTLVFHTTPTTLAKLQTIIPTLDVLGPELTLYSYKIRNASSEQVMTRLQQMTSSMQDKALLDALKSSTLIPESNTLVFHTTSALNTKIQNILSTIDVKGDDLQLYIYKTEHASKKQILSSLEQLASTMQNKEFSSAIAQVKWIEDSRSFMFHATPSAIEKLQAILPTLDAESPQLQIYSYSIKNAAKEQITARLSQVSSTIQDKELLDAIKTASLIPESNTILFSATPKANTKLQNLLTTLDVKGSESHLYMYKAEHVSAEQLSAKLKQMTDTIQSKELLDAISTLSITSGNNTLAFHATPGASTELQNILTTLDSKGPELQLYMVKVLHAPQKQLIASLTKISNTMQDKELSDAIDQMQWIPESNTLMFHGSPATLAKLKTILSTLDAGGPDLQPYTYSIQNAPKEQILSRLTQMASTIQNGELSAAIQSASLIPGSSTLIFYATSAVNTQIQNILTTLDVVGQQLYMYQIKNAPYKQIASSLKQLTDSLQNKELSDAVNQMKWIEKSNTLMFNVNADTLAKLQSILDSLDIGGPDLQLHMYKIQTGPKEHVLDKLKQIAATIQDKDLLAAIQSAALIPESNTLIFHATAPINEQLQTILSTLDVPDSQLQIYMYKIKHTSQEQIASSLKQLASTIQNKDLSDAIAQMKWIEKSNTLMFNAIPSAIAKLQDILATLDVAGPELQLYMYKVLLAKKEDVLSRLKQMSSTIQDKELLDAIQSASVMPDSNTILFHATPTADTKLQSILSTLDVNGLQIYMYKIQNTSKDQLISSLKQLSGTIQSKELEDAISQMKWIQESNTLMFHATPIAIEKLQTLLPSLDVKAKENHFLLYNPKNQTGEELQKGIEELSSSLASSGLQNTPLLNALNSMKWVPSSNSLIFTGDTASTDRIQVILQNLDVPSVNNAPFSVFVYKPVHASQKQMQTAITYYAQNLNPATPSDQQLIQAISTAEWIPETLSFLFKSNADTWEKLQKILTSLDNSKSFADTQPSTFYLYKLQHIPGNILIQDLKTLADSLPSDDSKSKLLINTINGLKWVKENNSVLITGPSSSIDQIKNIIVDFDANFQSQETPVSLKSEFFIYKHQNLSAEEIRDALKNLAQDLSSSALANPDLIHTLETVSIVSSTGSLLFTGTVDSLAKVKTLLLTVDTKEPSAAPVQTLGSTVFLIYKIKQTPPDALIQALQNFATHLTQADVEDKALEQSLSSVKWIKETNSLLFTGPQTALEKAEKLAEKFDLGTSPEAPRSAPSSFVVYVPRFQTGEALITILSDFMQNLVQSGVADSDLFDSIKHLRFIEKTNSLIISGSTSSIQKIQDLLLKFDKEAADNSTIASIDSSSFLIYKLQYHPGVEILEAVKKVAASLSNSAPEANKALIDAVDSLQWLEVTNSLLGTGTPEILAKIRELILNLDVPLRQVFIEVLVIETSLFNSQNFGLQWGSQLQYLNKTIGAIGNFPTTVSNFTNGGGNTPPGTINMANPINNTTNLNTPVQGNPNINSSTSTAVPFSTGFDLGVIGDILFHKGQSFISLGSLLNALQVDNDTTVVMNPKLITQDGHTSNIFVGQNIPFVGSFVSNTASNTVQSSNIEYRDVGVNLTITPTLGTNNVITLDINQDISEQTNSTTSIQGSQVTGIQTNHTTMNTRVHVPDRHFLVLSGMIQDTKTHFRSGIPCLGGLPVIGALFAENDRLNTKANIIIFLRPFIIDSFEDYDNITSAEEDLYKERAGLQALKEEFDAGTEMIKDLNND